MRRSRRWEPSHDRHTPVGILSTLDVAGVLAADTEVTVETGPLIGRCDMPGPFPPTELKHLEAELKALRAENARLRRLLDARGDAGVKTGGRRSAPERADRIRAMLHDSGSRNP